MTEQNIRKICISYPLDKILERVTETLSYFFSNLRKQSASSWKILLSQTVTTTAAKLDTQDLFPSKRPSLRRSIGFPIYKSLQMERVTGIPGLPCNIRSFHYRSIAH